MKTTPLRIVGSTLSLFGQRTSKMLWTMIGMLLVATALSLTAQPALSSAGGLVGHWNFDEGIGPVAADSSGFGNDGQLLDGPSWSWQSRGLANPFSLYFDGVDDHVKIGNSPSLNPPDQITLAAWIYPVDLSASGEIIAKSNGTDPQYYLRAQAGGKIRFGIGGTVLNGNTTHSRSQWYLVAGTYDGSAMKIYVNGVLDAVMSKSGLMHDNGVDVWIGCRDFRTPLAFNGLIQDPRIFSRALSANEIQSLVIPPGQVVITSPANGQTFVQYLFDPPPSVGITAEVSNFSAPVIKVDFYVHSELIGTATQAPYSVVYQNPNIGLNDQIVAVATDTLGNTVSSDPYAFSFYVCFYDDLHFPDYLRIVSPISGSVFTYGDPIYISVDFRDNCGVWIGGGIDLYMDGSLLLGHLAPGASDFVWQNAPVGSHSILAINTSHDTTIDYSDRINITVVVPGNQAPTVAITSPADGAVFNIGADLPIHVAAQDPDGSVVQIQLQIIGYASFASNGPDLDYTFHSLGPGTYALLATATDNGGATATGTVIHVTYAVPPTVVITSPADGAVFSAGADIPVHVTAQDSDGSVVQIQLTDGTMTFTSTATDFDYTFLSLAVGNYTLTATATDNVGAVGTTSVRITVGNALPPANDDFANSFDLAQITTGNNVNATREPGEPPSVLGPSAGHSVWWHWTALRDGFPVISTFGSSFHTFITVYTGNAIDNLYEVGHGEPNSAIFLATAGTTYQIAIDGAPGETGDIQLNVRYDSLPTVSLTSPSNGDSFVFGTTIHLTAIANDSDGLVSEVQFYIYPGSQRFSVYSSPYEFDWTPDTRGKYSVVAIAIDNDNWSSVTPDILISVQ